MKVSEEKREEFEGIFRENTGVIKWNGQELRDEVWEWHQVQIHQAQKAVAEDLLIDMEMARDADIAHLDTAIEKANSIINQPGEGNLKINLRGKKS